MVIDPAKNQLPYHLEIAIKKVYEPAGLIVTRQAIRELESADYGACRLELDNNKIVFRVAKITPTKIGQFVTIWKRPFDVTIPFDSNDPIDFIVIEVRDGPQAGQFIFDRKTLIEKGIMTHKNRKGKMGIRVYPPWIKPIAKQAIKTQQWQLHFFYSFDSNIKDILKFFN